MAKHSRYENSTSFQQEPGSSVNFPGVRPRDVGPAEGIMEHMLIEWDRMDLLSLNYYNDTDLWWRILDANPDILCAIDIELNDNAQKAEVHSGDIILIPRDRE